MDRRGVALLVVMVAIALSLTLTLAFLQTQATLTQIDSNTVHRGDALRAARTGAAIALRQIQRPGWGGVGEALSATISTDAFGTTSYEVTFEKPPAATAEVPQEYALSLIVKSVGTWQSAEDSLAKTQRTVEVLVRLQPRLAGRAIAAGDSALANDLHPNPGDYDRIQQYALYAQRDTSLVLDPQARIDGRMRIQGGISLFDDPHWSSSIRRDYLDSLKNRHVPDGQPAYPHPFGANGIDSDAPLVTFEAYASSSLRNDLDRIGVSHADADSSLNFPDIDYSAWRTYRLYDGGFEYEAQLVGSRLEDVTLGPSPTNPLGIFYREGSIELDDDVTIVGTLVSSNRIEITGESVLVASAQPRDAEGNLLFPDAGTWPQLPAIVAREIEIDRSIRARVEGNLVVERELGGAGGDFEYRLTPQVDLSGTATSRPVAQPFSLVTISGTQSLSSVRENEEHAIWLADGTSGSWYPIRTVDPLQRKLVIAGQVEHTVPTTFRIARNRLRYIDIHGSLAGEEHDIDRTGAWGNLTSIQWFLLHYEWKKENDDRSRDGLSPIEFVDWLADPSNLIGWGLPYSTHGLSLEPTFHLQHAGTGLCRFSAPLFRPWSADDSAMQFAGYRWKVLSWRELP